MAFFTVSEKSFHTVCEVTSEHPRVAISGWLACFFCFVCDSNFVFQVPWTSYRYSTVKTVPFPSSEQARKHCALSTVPKENR